MLGHWKKTDKEEREAKKKAQKESEEKRKREDEIREAKRQQRKLNFLLTQTELYSHFMKRKAEDNIALDLDNDQSIHSQLVNMDRSKMTQIGGENDHEAQDDSNYSSFCE